MKGNKEIIEMLYNNFESVPFEAIDRNEFYLKHNGEYIHIANTIDNDYTYLFDKIKKIIKTKSKFVIVYQDSMLRAVHELSGGAIRILLYLSSQATYNNVVYDFKYEDLVKELGMSYQTITGAIAELKQHNYIKTTGKRTNLVYHISPGFCWKGSVYHMYNKLKMFLEQ